MKIATVSTQKPCPFGLELRKFALNYVVVIFFKNAKKKLQLVV